MTSSSNYTASKLLYSFSYVTPEGGAPNAVVLTSHNVILGTTNHGGNYDGGAIYNLGPSGSISAIALHAFAGNQTTPPDGLAPDSGLSAGPFNRYYGTTPYTGESNNVYTGDGTVYEVSSSRVSPAYQVIYRFGGIGDGINPTYDGSLAVDPQGHLYGETMNGGANGGGTVFMLTHDNAGWHEQVIYSFQASQQVGNVVNLFRPAANVVLDATGNLYGCAQGGKHNTGGIFELTPPAQPGAAWQESVLYNFGDQPLDPNTVSAGCGIALDKKTGLIVGTSFEGGQDNAGTIFTLTPPAAGQSLWTEAVGHSFHGNYNGSGKATFHPYTPLVEVNGVYYGGSADSNEYYAFTP